MAYLNANERKALLDELTGMSFWRAKWKLQHMDPKGRLALYRTVQNVNEWITRFDLNGLGTRVTLVESKTETDAKGNRQKVDYAMVKVMVEPTPQNRS